MLRRQMGFFLFCLWTAVAWATPPAAPLQLLTEENPPFNFTRDGKVTGFAVEVVQEIQHRLGTQYPIKVEPWTRGYLMVQSVPNVALFDVVRTQKREQLFQWVGPVNTAEASFYARRGSTLSIKNVDDAKRVAKVVVPRGWYIHDALRRMGFTNLYAVETPEVMVKSLMANEATLIVISEPGIDTLLSVCGMKPQEVKKVYPLFKNQDYIAFSLGTPHSVVHAWQQALDGMKSDGRFGALYNKWFPGLLPAGMKADADVWPSSKRGEGNE